MKKNILFIGIITLMFIIMYWVNLESPAKFIWKPTYDIHDKQPYGAYALDKMLKSSWDEEYIHSYDGITDLYEYDEMGKNKNLLILCNRLHLTSSDLENLLKYIENGGNALIAADFFDSSLEDSLGFSINTNYLNFSLPVNLSLQSEKTALFIGKDSITGIPKSMLRNYFIFPDKGKEKLVVAADAGNHPILLRYPIGEGNLILSSTPLLFTNYAVLSDSMNPVTRQALAYLKGKPLVRTEHYETNVYNGGSASPFRYLLSQPALKWAYYIVLFTVIVFMIFTAKRKQKPIPVIQSPPNKMLDFVRSISSLYLMKNNNADIILKKYIYWSDEMRRKYGIDSINEEHDKAFIYQFSAKTGMPESDARHLFLELDAIREHTNVSDTEMMNLITKMKID